MGGVEPITVTVPGGSNAYQILAAPALFGAVWRLHHVAWTAGASNVGLTDGVANTYALSGPEIHSEALGGQIAQGKVCLYNPGANDVVVSLFYDKVSPPTIE